MYLKLGWHLFKKKMFSNILLIILIALSIFITNVCIGVVNYQFSMVNAVRNFDLKNTYYYVDNIFEYDSFKEEKTAEHINDVLDTGKTEVSLIYYGKADLKRKSRISTVSRYVTYVGIDKKTSDKFNVNQLSEGVWYTQAPKKDGFINAVAVEGRYSVGDVIPVEIYEWVDISETKMEYRPSYINFIVTGLVKEGTSMFEPTTFGSETSLLDMISKVSPDKLDGEKTILFFSYEDDDIKDYTRLLNLTNAGIIYLDNNTPPESIEKLNRTGWVCSFQEIYDNTHEYLVEQVMKFVPFLFGTALLTIVSLICLMILNSIDNMKTYSIYYLCGMNMSDMKKLLISYSCIMMSGACIVAVAIWGVFVLYLSILRIAAFDFNNILISAVLAAVVILLMLLAPLAMIARHSPKEALLQN